MRNIKFALLLIIVFIVPSVSSAGGILPRGIDGEDDTGGPDDYGYTWIDSNEPTGPDYNWVDISESGELVMGMGDDVCIGPFDMGFDFVYYWYTVSELFIGSNGYIIFGQAANLAQPFPASIPLTDPPNDFIAAYMADWIPGGGGSDSTLFWTNHSDSCIVSFINYPAFVTGGTHTFQVILTNSDSSITFQYGLQQGLALNNDLLIGIESQTGFTGLEHSHDQYISYNHSAVRFEYPSQVNIDIHDLAATTAGNDPPEGFFILADRYFFPWGIAQNVGDQVEGPFSYSLAIEAAQAGVVYVQTGTIGTSLEPGGSVNIENLPFWIPTEEGQYVLSLDLNMAGDMNVYNDSIATECHVMRLPGTMLYDDGSAELAWRWEGGEGGLAQRFIPPDYYARIDSISFYIAEDGGTVPLEFEILDDDSPGGAPGTVLHSGTLPVPTAGWYTIDISSEEIIVYDGAYYVAWYQVDTRAAGLGIDNSLGEPVSLQAWEYTGSWQPFRDGRTSDIMIRSSISWIQPPNRAPEILAFSPAQLDTLVTDPDIYFWAIAFDPDEDPITWEWRLDEEIVGTDSSVWIHFPMEGYYQVSVRVTDGEYADSVTWSINAQVGVLPEPVQGMANVFELEAVHPNPFNSQADISFVLPTTTRAELVVYDISGRAVATLLDQTLIPGRYVASLEGNELPSGLYLVSLRAGGRTNIQKIVHLK